MNNDPYFHQLYPFQDRILLILNKIETPFYLTGGTALARGYLQLRYSDDLDFFADDDSSFKLHVDRAINQLLSVHSYDLDVVSRAERYTRLSVIKEGGIILKLEFINDVPSHIGEIVKHPELGKLDSAENILANKVTAVLSREEPKDLADIWGICTRIELPLEQAITDAKSKASGIFPADLARVLLSTSQSDWEVINWIEPPTAESFVNDLHRLGKDLLLIK